MTQVKLLTDAIDAFIKGCKADGNWDQIKACCIMAAWDGLNGALVPIKGPAPTNFNFVSADYNRKTGLKGDGSTKYLDSNRAGNADPLDNHHLSAFLTDAGSPETTITHIGGGIEDSDLTDIGLLSNNRLIMRSRRQTGASDASASIVLGSAINFLALSRFQAADYTQRFLGSDRVVELTPQGASGFTYTPFARNGSPPSALSDARLSFYSIGESIDLAALDTRVTNLMTAIDGAIA